jgi:tetratricopeptide (TPR) repeat protein
MSRTFGKFREEKQIGGNGVSAFLLAVHSETGEKAVVKFLAKDAAPGLSEESLKLLHGEAEIAKPLDFANIVPILEVGETPEGLFIAFELEKGPSLAKYLEQNPVPLPEQAAVITLEVAKALAHGHGRGVYHKNLKLTNVFLRKGNRVGVADFGLARIPDPMEGSASGVDFSTGPEFLAPEQVRGDYDMVDQRTDIYALGILLYTLLTGRSPFPTDKPGSIQYKILKTAPPPPRTVNRGVPKELEAICQKCLNPQMHLRYWSMAETAMDLKRFLDGEPVQAMADRGAAAVLGRALGSRGRLAAVAAVALVLVVAGLLILGGRGGARKSGKGDKASAAPGEGKAAPQAKGGEPGKSSQAEAALKAALEHALAQGMVKKRIRALRRVVAKHPDFPAARAHLGFAEVFAGRLNHGLDSLAKASEKDPDLGLIRYFWGFVYLHYLQAPERALDEWEKAAAQTPGRVENLLASAWMAWVKEKDFGKAIEILQGALDQGAADWEVSFLLGYMNGTKEEPDDRKALKEYRTVEAETGGFPPALYHAARVFLRQGKPGDAERSLVKAVRIAPSYLDAVVFLSDFLIQRGAWEEAAKQLDYALVLVPTSSAALTKLAECRLKTGRVDDAIEELDRVLELNPREAPALLVRAEAHALKKDMESADRDYEAAMEAAPEDARYAYAYARFLESIPSLTSAIAFYGKAVEVDPNHLAAYQRRADLYFRTKDYLRAKADYESILRLNPRIASAYIGVAYVYYHILRDNAMARDYLLSGLRYCAKDDPRYGDIEKFFEIVKGG